MKIILEGPDNSGKSTLARELSRLLELPIYWSGGPLKSEVDAFQRWHQYAQQREGIYDRHFVISEEIYRKFFPRIKPVNLDPFQFFFYEQQPLLVYCENRTRSISNHVAGSHTDTPEYLQQLSHRQADICSAYDRWAEERSPVRYVIGMPIIDLLDQLKLKAAA